MGLDAYSLTCYPLSEHLEQAILHLRGGGVTPYDGLYGVAPPERGILAGFRVMKGKGFHLLTYMKG